MNTLERMSFNFGSTLLEWMERQAPATYGAILEADRLSRKHLGHGNAIAMPYHHVILPLSTLRDKITEVRWGIADFRRRFGREPVGMWLPETAVDHETLEVVAAHGIRFTIVAPQQVVRAPRGGLPGIHRTASGDSIALFVYDGPMSHDVAFGPLVRDAGAWLTRIALAEADGARLISVATDGETYGHHHKFGEMALAQVLTAAESVNARPENFASFLARHPPTEEVELVSPSAWSCVHGVGRWMSDCGCRMAAEPGWNQQWRAPLRKSVTWLAEQLHDIFDREGRTLFPDPWRTRDAYGAVVAAESGAVRAFVAGQVSAPATPEALVRAGELLELERDALRMFTSCAWFFDDLAGIETIQVLRYAARAIELSGSAAGLEQGLLARLADAHSNDTRLGTGPDIYLRSAKPPVAPAARIGAGLLAVRRMAPGRALLAYWALEESGDQVSVIHTPTGRARTYTARLDDPGLSFSVTLTGRDGTVAVLTLRDIPESQRDALAAVFRGMLIDEWLETNDRARIAHAEATPRQVARDALVRAIETLATDATSRAVERVLHLVALHDSMDLHVPFDAQTAFARLERRHGSEWDALAGALGFRLKRPGE
ncbi:MAG: DUF3536 domain-containing protein [Gemmatimonadota bacterium]